jgi:hypothetical protein
MIFSYHMLSQVQSYENLHYFLNITNVPIIQHRIQEST